MGNEDVFHIIDLNGTIVNLELPYLHGGSLEISLKSLQGKTEEVACLGQVCEIYWNNEEESG